MSVLETVLWIVARVDRPLLVKEIIEAIAEERNCYKERTIRIGVSKAFRRGYLKRVFIRQTNYANTYAYAITPAGRIFLSREKQTIILEEEEGQVSD